jgi:hypothetical protein
MSDKATGWPLRPGQVDDRGPLNLPRVAVSWQHTHTIHHAGERFEVCAIHFYALDEGGDPIFNVSFVERDGRCRWLYWGDKGCLERTDGKDYDQVGGDCPSAKLREAEARR